MDIWTPLGLAWCTDTRFISWYLRKLMWLDSVRKCSSVVSRMLSQPNTEVHASRSLGDLQAHDSPLFSEYSVRLADDCGQELKYLVRPNFFSTHGNETNGEGTQVLLNQKRHPNACLLFYCHKEPSVCSSQAFAPSCMIPSRMEYCHLESSGSRST